MNWINILSKLPEIDGTYIISVSKLMKLESPSAFTVIAYYNNKINKWYKYDPFIENPIGEEITDHIIGWVEGASLYLGGSKNKNL